MIESFGNKETLKLWQGGRHKFPPDIEQRAANKLKILDAATSIDDLKAPPSNHLEALSGTRQGQHSIRINNQWRICFYWNNGNPHEVEITDYHA